MQALTLAGLSLLLISCSTTPNAANAKEAIRARDNAWRAAVQKRDAQAVASFWTEDAVLFSAHQGPLVGRPALLQMVQGAFQDPSFKIQWDDGELIVAASGDIAYQVTKTRMSMTPSGSNEMVEQSDTVTIWRKDADGQWRCVVDISTPLTDKPTR